jgi:DNA polymerase V
MEAVDRLNMEFGKGTVYTASMGIEDRRSWVMRRGHVSPRYTTCWEDLPSVLPPEEAQLP